MTTPSKLEQVARAMWEVTSYPFPWEQVTPEAKAVYVKFARAAIAAMELPTEEIVEAGIEVRPTDDITVRLDNLAQSLAGEYPPHTLMDLAEAASLIERLRDERPDVLQALESASAWLERWARHVGSCAGGEQCTCGLTAIRAETEAAIAHAQA